VVSGVTGPDLDPSHATHRTPFTPFRAPAPWVRALYSWSEKIIAVFFHSSNKERTSLAFSPYQEFHGDEGSDDWEVEFIALFFHLGFGDEFLLDVVGPSVSSAPHCCVSCSIYFAEPDDVFECYEGEPESEHASAFVQPDEC